MSKRIVRLDALTSLRFVAALLVFIWHVSVYIGTKFFFNLQVGYAGVGFFYILSGFILTYVYFDKLKEKTGTIKDFYISRVSKLFPMHILTFLVALPLTIPVLQSLFPIHTKITAVGTAAVNLGLLQAWFPQEAIHFSFNGVAWSISVELFFYAMFPLIIFLVIKYLKNTRIRGIGLLMTILWLGVTLVFLPDHALYDEWIFYIFPPARLIDFVMGILLALIFLKQSTASLTWKKLFGSRSRATVIEVASIALLCIGFGLSIFMPQTLRFALWLMPFWVFVIFVFAQQKGVVSKFLMKKPLVFLGDISFSFYMIHQLIIRYVSMLHISNFFIIAISLSFAILLSSLLYIFYEEPLRKRLRQRLSIIKYHPHYRSA